MSNAVPRSSLLPSIEIVLTSPMFFAERTRTSPVPLFMIEAVASEADALIEGARLQAAPETRVRRDAVSALAAGCARRFFCTTVCAFQRRWPRLTASRFGLLLSQRLILATVSLTRWKASISDGFYPER